MRGVETPLYWKGSMMGQNRNAVECVSGGRIDGRMLENREEDALQIYRKIGHGRGSGGLTARAHGMLHLWRGKLAVLLGDAVETSWQMTVALL